MSNSARGDGRYARMSKNLVRVQVLIPDDWAITPPTSEQRRGLMEIADDRHDRASTIADAVPDRLAHGVHRLELKGEGMRKPKAAEAGLARIAAVGLRGTATMISLVNARYFLAIVDNGTLSAAAAQLGVSQPTLSQQLARLEAGLGQRLLLRTPAGVVVTEAGRTFYRHARILAAQVERAEAELGSVGEDGSDRVSLGLATCGAAASLALPVLRRLRAEHKSIRLRLNDNFAGTLSEFIMTGRIDLALAYTTAPMAGVNQRDLFTEDLVLVAPRSLMPARRRGAAVPITELRGVPTVMLSPVHLLRTVFERACARAGFEPRVVAEIDSLRALLMAVAGGLGATVLPRAALDAVPAGLAIHRLGPEPLEVAVSLCTSAQLPMTPSIKLVGDLVVQLVQDRLADGAWAGVRPSPA